MVRILRDVLPDLMTFEGNLVIDPIGMCSLQSQISASMTRLHHRSIGNSADGWYLSIAYCFLQHMAFSLVDHMHGE